MAETDRRASVVGIYVVQGIDAEESRRDLARDEIYIPSVVRQGCKWCY